MVGIEAANRKDGRIEGVRVAERRRLAGRSNRAVDMAGGIIELRRVKRVGVPSRRNGGWELLLADIPFDRKVGMLGAKESVGLRLELPFPSDMDIFRHHWHSEFPLPF